MLPHIEIIVGTYEEFLLGYQLTQPDADGLVKLKQTFADKSHAGSIKCLAVQGQWIASGGSDDRIFVYDMRSRKQSQILLSHAGTINALTFSPDLTHLLSGSADGHMIATRVGSWITEGDWRKAHAGSPVTYISCHPSSKLALSLGGDQILNTWNLVKGRVAYKTNLKSKRTLGSCPECLSWSADGEHFTLSGPLVLEVWNIKTAQVIRRAKMPAKPICVTWLNETECLTGLENGTIAWITLTDQKEEAAPKILPAHAARVKALAYMQDTLATVSSAGEIKLWHCELDKQQLELLAGINMDCRPTCLGLLDLSQFGNVRPRVSDLSQTQAKTKESSAKTPEATRPAPKGFVTIEYEQEGTPESSTKQQKQKKLQKATAKSPKGNHSEEKVESESDSEDSFNSDSDSDSSSQQQRRPPKRKPAAAPAPAAKSKRKFKKN